MIEKIDKSLCPKVIVNSELKKYIEENIEIENDNLTINEVAEVYSRTRLFERYKRIWITGSPSMGKSVSLEIFKIALLKNHVVFRYFDLKGFNDLESEAYEKRKEQLEIALFDEAIDVILLDSYDELDDSGTGIAIKEALNRLIPQSIKSIVITSRFNDDTSKVFKEYKSIVLREFSEDRIRGILQDKITDIKSVNSKFFEIINNTMILKMFIDLWNSCANNNAERLRLINASNTGSIIFKYLKKVFFAKEKISKIKNPSSKQIKDTMVLFDDKISSIGEYFCPSGENKNAEINENFRGIFFYKSGKLQAKHQEYADFASGYYIAKKISESSQEAKKVLDISFSSFEQRRILLYAGQCLQFLNEELVPLEFKSGKEVFRELNVSFPKKNNHQYAWLVHIWSSFRNNVLDNDDKCFVVGNRQLKYILKKHSFFKPTTINLPVKSKWMKHYNVWVPEKKMLVSESETSRLRDYLPFKETNITDKTYFALEKREHRLSNIMDLLKETISIVPMVLALIALVFAVLHVLNVVALPSFMQDAIDKTVGLFYNRDEISVIVLYTFWDSVIFTTCCFLCIIVITAIYTCIASALVWGMMLILFFVLIIIYKNNCYNLNKIAQQIIMEIQNEIYRFSKYEHYLNRLNEIKIAIGYQESSVFNYSRKLVFDLNIERGELFEELCIDVMENIVCIDWQQNKSPSRNYAIKLCEDMEELFHNGGDRILYFLYNRAKKEFIEASDDEYAELISMIEAS